MPRKFLPISVSIAFAMAGCSSTTDPGPAQSVNLASGGTATASAVWEGNPNVGPAKAIDGSSYEDSGAAPTYWVLPNRTQGWWQVDLGRDCDISSIEIHNTHNSFANDRATRDFRVEIQDSARNVVYSHAGILPFTGRSSAGRPIPPFSVTPEKPKSGRIVRIYVDSWHPTRTDPAWPHPVVGSSQFNEGGGLNEVRVLGTPAK